MGASRISRSTFFPKKVCAYKQSIISSLRKHSEFNFAGISKVNLLKTMSFIIAVNFYSIWKVLEKFLVFVFWRVDFLEVLMLFNICGWYTYKRILSNLLRIFYWSFSPSFTFVELLSYCMHFLRLLSDSNFLNFWTIFSYFYCFIR